MSIVEVEQYADSDDGEYLVLSGRVGRVSYELTVEDGVFGRKVKLRAVGDAGGLMQDGKSSELAF